MSTNGLQAIVDALDGKAAPLSQETWAQMYSRVWDLYDAAIAENEKLRLSLLYYAGKESRQPN